VQRLKEIRGWFQLALPFIVSFLFCPNEKYVTIKLTTGRDKIVRLILGVFLRANKNRLLL
jgi:hypothetical protein